jgi:hypothetical protein
VKDRTLTHLSLAFSIGALAYASWIHHYAEQMATQAIQRRELEFVAHYSPKVREFYSGLTGHTNAYASEPKTLEELLAPITETVNRVGGPEGSRPRDP